MKEREMNLPEGLTLTGLQDHVRRVEKERGFSDDSVQDCCLLLGEEIGELFKAIRKERGIKVAQDSEASKISGELADVLFLTISIANKLGINLEEAFIEKEERNSRRTWG